MVHIHTQTHTRVWTLIHLQTAIIVQQMLALAENSWYTNACLPRWEFLGRQLLLKLSDCEKSVSLTGFPCFFYVWLMTPCCHIQTPLQEERNKVSWLLQWEKSLSGFWILLYVLVGVSSVCWWAGWEATSQCQVWAKGQGDTSVFACLRQWLRLILDIIWVHVMVCRRQRQIH